MILRSFLIGTIVLCAPLAAVAEDSSLSGHLKYQGSYDDFDSEDIIRHTLDARLNTAKREEDWEGVLEGQALMVSSDTRNQSLLLQQPQRDSLTSDRRRLFDLTAILDDEGETVSALRVDRAFISHTSPDAVVRAGRQAISFGNGLVFHVLDIFNPFPPTAIDKEYKTGDDMLYTQLIFGTNADLQLMIVPRRDVESHDVEGDESSFGGMFHTRIEDARLDLDMMATRHYGENVVGLGASRDVLDAVVRGDVSLTRTDDGGSLLSALGNIDRSFTLFEKNLYIFLEIFHSGVGSSEDSYLTMNYSRNERLGRGELYVLGRNYLATGFRLEVAPRTNVYGSAILNLSDTSSVLQARVAQELSQNVSVIGGVNLPCGGHGSEFGGIAVPTGETLLDVPIESYVRLEWYF